MEAARRFCCSSKRTRQQTRPPPPWNQTHPGRCWMMMTQFYCNKQIGSRNEQKAGRLSKTSSFHRPTKEKPLCQTGSEPRPGPDPHRHPDPVTRSDKPKEAHATVGATNQRSSFIGQEEFGLYNIYLGGSLRLIHTETNKTSNFFFWVGNKAC